MGALDHLSGFFDCSSGSSKLKKRRQLQVRSTTTTLRSHPVSRLFKERNFIILIE
uniref:Uncharacterized protein n=1 Tax=Populus trichocarpa TaxID=3694 RepID=A9PC25_POPTR|nr:unknown [Populus trichocarpa]